MLLEVRGGALGTGALLGGDNGVPATNETGALVTPENPPTTADPFDLPSTETPVGAGILPDVDDIPGPIQPVEEPLPDVFTEEELEFEGESQGGANLGDPTGVTPADLVASTGFSVGEMEQAILTGDTDVLIAIEQATGLTL